MLNDNLQSLRKAKGISQEELAVKLNVVRQTVSKWEKGLSVPDSEMLIRIAEELDTTVTVLLGESVPVNEESELKTIAAKLELLNEQFAKRNETHRKIWKAVFLIILIIAACILITDLAATLHYHAAMAAMKENVSIIGGSDGPTSIVVSSVSFFNLPHIVIIAAAVISAVCLYKMRKNK